MCSFISISMYSRDFAIRFFVNGLPAPLEMNAGSGFRMMELSKMNSLMFKYLDLEGRHPDLKNP